MINSFKKAFLTFVILIFSIAEINAEIKDSLFASVGNKAVTYSDILNEIKITLISNGQVFSKDNKKQIQQQAVKSMLQRVIKKIEIEKFAALEFNPQDLNNELERMANFINLNLDEFKNIFISQNIDFSIVEEQIKTELLWNSLIFQRYSNKLSINLDEIDEQLKLYENKAETNEYLISEIVLAPVQKSEVNSKIKDFKDRVKAEGFEATVANLSISKTSKRGGDLGWLNESIISTNVRAYIKKTKVGEITEPIFIPEGILFFKVRDKRKGGKKISLEEYKNKLVQTEKTKILNMYSLSHYEDLQKKTTINYY